MGCVLNTRQALSDQLVTPRGPTAGPRKYTASLRAFEALDSFTELYLGRTKTKEEGTWQT